MSVVQQTAMHHQAGGAVLMKRRFGVCQSVAILLGLVVGSSIFITPSGVVRGVHSAGAALVVWALCGVFSTFGALTFAELGTTYPEAGGLYMYIRTFYGPFLATVFLWAMTMVVRPAANAIKALTFALYVLKPLYPDCEPPVEAQILIAIAMASFVAFINIMNVTITGRWQTLLTSVTAGSVCLLSIAGYVYIGREGSPYLHDMFVGTNRDPGDISLAVYSGLYAYGGWGCLNYMVEEIKNPERNLPVGIIVTMLVTTSLYMAVNLAYLAVLGPQGVMDSPAVAMTMMEKVYPWGKPLVCLMVAVSAMASTTSGLLVGSRSSYAGGRAGHVPRVLSAVHVTKRSPITSIISQMLIVIPLCVVGDVYFILTNLIFVKSLFATLAVVGLLWSRWKQPELKRPLRMPLFVPMVYLVMALSVLGVPLIKRPTSCVSSLVLATVFTVPYYILFVIRPWKLERFHICVDRFSLWLQKLLLAVPSSPSEADQRS